MMEVARVKNGFLDKEWKGGYRDIKINVVFHSSANVDTELSHICEIQFVLNQYLWEKKKLHRLYSIQRLDAYFKMVVQNEKAALGARFNKVNKLTKIFDLSQLEQYKMNNAFRNSVDSDTHLLAFENIYDQNCIFVFDLMTKESIFQHPIYSEPYSPEMETLKGTGQTHQWITLKGQKYLCFQSSKSQMKFFKVIKSENGYKFEEDIAMNFDVKDKEINYVDVDASFEHIYMILDFQILQQRAMSNIQSIKANIRLPQKIEWNGSKQMSLSHDGKLCAVGGGEEKNFFYLVDVETGQHTRIESTCLNIFKGCYCPCFINGEKKQIAVGDERGKVEIFDIESKSLVRTIKALSAPVSSLHSVNNMLAVAGGESALKVFYVPNWTVVLEEKFKMRLGKHLHLSSDNYLSFGGVNSKDDDEACIVWKIE